MPCGAIKEDGYKYCHTCTCDSKICFGCGKDTTLAEYQVTKKPHIIRIPANKERVYKCNKCLSK